MRRVTPVVLLVMLSTVGCGEDISSNPNDTTPPTIRVSSLLKNVSTANGPVSISYLRGETDQLLGLGEDTNGGMALAELSGGLTISCTNDQTGLGTVVQPTVYFSAAPSAPAGQSHTTATAAMPIDPADWHNECRNGSRLVSVTGSMQAVAKNAVGLRATSPALSFSYRP